MQHPVQLRVFTHRCRSRYNDAANNSERGQDDQEPSSTPVIRRLADRRSQDSSEDANDLDKPCSLRPASNDCRDISSKLREW